MTTVSGLCHTACSASFNPWRPAGRTLRCQPSSAWCNDSCAHMAHMAISRSAPSGRRVPPGPLRPVSRCAAPAPHGLEISWGCHPVPKTACTVFLPLRSLRVFCSRTGRDPVHHRCASQTPREAPGAGGHRGTRERFRRVALEQPAARPSACARVLHSTPRGWGVDTPSPGRVRRVRSLGALWGTSAEPVLLEIGLTHCLSSPQSGNSSSPNQVRSPWSPARRSAAQRRHVKHRTRGTGWLRGSSAHPAPVLFVRPYATPRWRRTRRHGHSAHLPGTGCWAQGRLLGGTRVTPCSGGDRRSLPLTPSWCLLRHRE